MEWNSFRKTKSINELGKNVTRFSLLVGWARIPSPLAKNWLIPPTWKDSLQLKNLEKVYSWWKHWLTLLQINDKILQHNICNFFRINKVVFVLIITVIDVTYVTYYVRIDSMKIYVFQVRTDIFLVRLSPFGKLYEVCIKSKNVLHRKLTAPPPTVHKLPTITYSAHNSRFHPPT